MMRVEIIGTRILLVYNIGFACYGTIILKQRR